MRTKLVRRKKKTTKTRPVLKRRTKIKLQRRPRKDVFYCEKREIKNRLPYPMECSWVGTMYKCCQQCKKKIIYTYWRQGGYRDIARQLENRTYKTDIAAEEEIYNKARDMY